MATKDTSGGSWELSRRDFLKATAATAAAGCVLDFAYDPDKAAAYEDNPAYTVKTTTCPYCSASCGQRVVVRNSDQQVVDLYGDFESPMNSGGLCAKGAGSIQLVNNPRRIGAWPTTPHPVNNVFASRPETQDGATPGDIDDFRMGVAYRRQGNGAWSRVGLEFALNDIAAKMKAARDANGNAPSRANGFNSKQVAFFGSSHMNNEENYLYRKLIANFGTSNTEHQARI